jgi:predicted TPR repeat methyltransferase
VLTALPRQPDALHLMGALRNMQGQAQEALALMEQSIALVPDDAGRWNDIGLVYARLARDADAIAAYQRSAELAGRSAMAAKALDNMARLQLPTDVSAAEATFRRALAIAPEFGLSWYGLAQTLLPQGRLAEALAASDRAIALSPQSGARELVAKALVRGQHTEHAIAYYQQWLQQDPGNPLVEHHLKALTQPLTAERASDAYVESTFDQFASSFDSKLARLGYRAPELILQALAALYPTPEAALDMADAGCGTGLCGPLVQPWAKRLCGFDLSGGML